MRAIRTKLAAMLAIFALAAYQSDVDAQTTRGRTGTSSEKRVTRPSGTASKPSGVAPRSSGSSSRPSVSGSSSADRKPSVTRNPSAARRPSVTERTPTTAKKPSSSNARPSTDVRRPSTTVTRPSTTVTRPSATVTRKPAVKEDRKPSFDRGDQNKPMNVTRPVKRPSAHRDHPRDRDFLVYDRPAHYWAGHDHCYGYRVRVLPSHVRRHVHYGVTYYCYNDIWYRPYGGYYVVCRPPFGTVLAANIISDMLWTAVRISYYHTVAETYSTINENNEYIARQNEVIAQNNAVIAAQNQMIAQNQQLASQAYSLANDLGLVQSYAAAGSSYYYQDGVFYVMDSNGEYKVILPPAGALVETLPEDFDMITLKGDEYYKVDDTIYKVTVSDGKPYFEVLGQLYS